MVHPVIGQELGIGVTLVLPEFHQSTAGEEAGVVAACDVGQCLIDLSMDR